MSSVSGSKSYLLQNKDGVWSVSFITWTKECISYLMNRKPDEVPTTAKRARWLHQAKKFIGNCKGLGKLEEVIGTTPAVPRGNLYTMMPIGDQKNQVIAMGQAFDAHYKLKDGEGAISGAGGRLMANSIADGCGMPSAGALDLEGEEPNKELEAAVMSLRAQVNRLHEEIDEHELREKMLIDTVALDQVQFEIIMTDVEKLLEEVQDQTVASAMLDKLKTGDYFDTVMYQATNTDCKRRCGAIRADDLVVNPERFQERYHTPKKARRTAVVGDISSDSDEEEEDHNVDAGEE